MNELTLERKIPAARDRVFAAWTQPELLRRWSAPRGMTVEDGANDLRVGGDWRVMMAAPDGTRFEAFGTYREIAAPERLAYTHAWRGGEGSTPETVLTLELTPEADGTRLVLRQAGFASPESRDGHREGWSSALDNLQTLFPASSASSGAAEQPAARTAGRFVWYDLLTTDAEAAKAFYTAAVGWTVQPFGDEVGGYAVWLAGDTQIGGVMQYPPAPPHWMAHIAVDDVDAAASRAEGLGGRIQSPPADISNVGRFAIIADPQGASFSLFRPSGQAAVPDWQTLGAVGWRELQTTNYDRAWAFYAELFGWKEETTYDMGESGTYHTFRHADDSGDAQLGGMSDAAGREGKPPHWLFYVNVDSMDGALARIREHGGQVEAGPMPVPGGGQSAHCLDPQGARFAIFSLE
ncbi:SRPBCC domain-containing protein [Longimicrobium sp.]|uniref:SRPBCC domain-containing protein n=1 Tax=Longimicrobium sp. TaxID=2029185 RepID=UPI003B3A33D8